MIFFNGHTNLSAEDETSVALEKGLNNRLTQVPQAEQHAREANSSDTHEEDEFGNHAS